MKLRSERLDQQVIERAIIEAGLPYILGTDRAAARYRTPGRRPHDFYLTKSGLGIDVERARPHTIHLSPEERRRVSGSMDLVIDGEQGVQDLIAQLRTLK